MINAKAEIIFEEDENFFHAVERTLLKDGTLRVNDDLITIEDFLEGIKEEELKDSKDEEKEPLWNYEPLEELLP